MTTTTPHPTYALPLPDFRVKSDHPVIVAVRGWATEPYKFKHWESVLIDELEGTVKTARREGYELAMRALVKPIHDPAVTTPREVLVGESPVDRIAAPAQEQPKSDAQIILDIITLFERRPEFKAAFREEWLRYTGVEQQQAGAVVSDEQISDLWLMSVDCVGLSRDKAISFARAVLALSQSGGNDGIR